GTEAAARAGAPSHRPLAPGRPGGAPHTAAPSRTFAPPGGASSFSGHGSYPSHQASQPRPSFHPSRSAYQPRGFQPRGASGPSHAPMSGHAPAGSSHRPSPHG